MNTSPAYVFSFDWSFPVAFFWGLLVIVSLAGWGWTVERWLMPRQDKEGIGWGTAAAWGMAVLLIFSGPMLMLELFSAGFVAFFLLAGLVLLAWTFPRRKKEAWSGPPTFGLKTAFVFLCLLIFVAYVGAVAAHGYNCGDDFAAYFPFVKMALDTGTLSDPFNLRMMGSVGGQPVLATLIAAFLPWKYVHTLDAGIALLIAIGMASELVRGADAKTWLFRLILVTLALFFPMPRNNSASEETGLVLFMAIFRLFEWTAAGRISGWRAAVLLGGVTAAVSTLRCHNLFIVITLGAGFLAWRFVEKEHDTRGIIREALFTFMVVVVLLVPWWIVSYRSSGVFLYPLIKGTQRPEFETYSRHWPPLQTLGFVVGFYLVSGYIYQFIPACLVREGKERRGALLLGGALLLISTAFVSQLTFSPYSDISRYLCPAGMAFALWTSGVVARQLLEVASIRETGLVDWQERLALFSIVVVLCFQTLNFVIAPQMVGSLKNVARFPWELDSRHQLFDYFGDIAPTDEADREYREAFAKIPPGSKTLIALDYPFLLDYHAHTIYSIDIAGAASPDPGLPYFHGAETVRQYLLSHGIRYIVHVPFDQSKFLHSRPNQKLKLTSTWPPLSFYAPFELDFYDNVDQLAKSNRVLYESPTVRVIDLRDEN